MKEHSHNRSMKRKSKEFNHNKDVSIESNQRRKFKAQKKLPKKNIRQTSMI